MRNSYWSSSKFAEFVRMCCAAPIKPEAATAEEWATWRKYFQSNHKFAYWFVEEFLDNAQDVVYWPSDKLNDVRTYVINRFVDKLHYLPTRFKPGDYYELDDRLLHGMFESLVDFVECEKAHMELMCNSKENELPWWYHSWITRWKSIRSREIGMKYLKWEADLDKNEENMDNGQADHARETIALYTWWKDVRPVRPDPYDVSGWSDICAKHDSLDDLLSDNKNEEEEKESKDSLNNLWQIEKQYDDEDEQMMIRLIKIRKGLWT